MAMEIDQNDGYMDGPNQTLFSSVHFGITIKSIEAEKDNMLPQKENSEIAEKGIYLEKEVQIRNDITLDCLEKITQWSLPGKVVSISMKASFISVIMCLMVVAITIVILVQEHQENEKKKQSVKEDETFPHEMCIQCIKLTGNQFNQVETDLLVSKLRTHIDNGIQMCCAQNTEQMSALFEATMREQAYRTESVPQASDFNLKFTPVSVHKSLLPGNDFELSLQEPKFSDGSEHFIVRFNKDFNDPLTEHVRGVHVLDTALEINYTGLYYVYLSVHMGSKFMKPAGLFRYQHWFQYVHRTSPDNPANTGILLQTSSTAHNDTNFHETAFAGGQFYLTKGDQIEVCVSAQGLVQYKKESTYLGLFMLENLI